MILSALLAALTVVAPRDGASVPQQKPLQLVWRGGTNAVYLLTVSRVDGEQQIFSVSNRTDAWIANLELGRRYDWSVRVAGSLDGAAAHFTVEAEPPRVLYAPGARNFRDLGGGRAADGRRVKQGRILRSSALSGRVTPAGVAVLNDEFRVRTDVDLRSSHGLSQSRVSALGEDVPLRTIPFDAGRRIDDVIRGREPFARLFGLLTAEKNYPFLLEDADDPERSDTLAFLLNGLLGVPEEDLRRAWTSSPAVLDGLLAYLGTLPGKTPSDRLASYAAGCGIAAEEIETFRSLMLEK